MTYGKIALLSLFPAGALLFTGCKEVLYLENVLSPSEAFIYKGHNFGENRDANYKQGVKDGCRTADGRYTKNHALFGGESDYRTGWEHGRLHCKGLTK